jgi:penicillin-binding protein 1A
VLARRQPGSAFKPLTYALALGLRDGDAPRFTAASTVPNGWRRFEPTGWSPRNVGGRYTPTSTLADGLASSHNVATASLLELAGGPDALVALAGRVGFDTGAFPRELGLALGQAEVTVWEMARWVGVVAAGGRSISASPVVSAIDAAGRERWPGDEAGAAVLDPGVAALVRELMGLVVTQGTGGAVRGRGGFAGYDGPIWGKTGTSDDEKDLWFVGGTPDVAGALWLGYDEPTRIGAAASDFSAPLFGWWMREVHEGLPRRRDFGGPELERRWVCALTGKVAMEGCRGINAPFLPGTAPPPLACEGGHPPEDVQPADHVSPWDVPP